MQRSLDQPASSHTESDDSTDTSGSSQSSEKDDTPPFDVTQEGHELTGYKLKVSSMDLELPQVSYEFLNFQHVFLITMSFHIDVSATLIC